MPASADAVPVFMPPGGPMEVMFSFDTTGSMSGCIAEVKTKVEEITRLFADIPGLRVMAHGDYCDASAYVTKFVDFTNDQKKLTDFVKKVRSNVTIFLQFTFPYHPTIFLWTQNVQKWTWKIVQLMIILWTLFNTSKMLKLPPRNKRTKTSIIFCFRWGARAVVIGRNAMSWYCARHAQYSTGALVPSAL